MKRSARIPVYGLLAVTAAVAAMQWWRIRNIQSATTASQANYSLIEPGFYMGGRQSMPPGTGAVLNLSKYKDGFVAEVCMERPIEDGGIAPSIEWLQEQVAFIDQQRQAGRTVYVHCDAGISRSGMVSAAYFMWRNHWSREQALAFLRAARPVVNPNLAQMELLTRWEKAIERGQ